MSAAGTTAPAASAPRLSMRGLGKRFGPTIALDGVDLEVAPGEIHALLGENGAGKSTLMKVLAGVIAPDTGAMALDGAPYRPRGPDHARRAGVAMIHQELALGPHLSVAENVMLGIEPTRGPLLDRRELRRRARAALSRVGRAELPLDVPVGTLGIADRQLVEIARAVAVGASVVVLDEPTSSLGRADVERLFALMRELRAAGTSLIYISHFLEEVRAIADRHTVLRDGRSVATGDLATTDDAGLVAAMVGRAVSELYPRSARTAGAPVLTVTGLAGARLPRDASLELHRGEVVGIAGLVGAGRSELLRAIFGLEPVGRGAVRVATVDGPATPARRWRQRVGFVSEDRKSEGLALGLSIAENAALPSLPRFLSPTAVATATTPWLDRLGVRRASPAQPVGALSGGNQQKVAVARLLHAGCDVLLLDEPTRGIDIGARATIYRLIDELARGAHGGPPCAVLVVSSYLPELLGTCDRIAVMSRGRLGPARPVAELDEHRILLEATASAGR